MFTTFFRDNCWAFSLRHWSESLSSPFMAALVALRRASNGLMKFSRGYCSHGPTRASSIECFWGAHSVVSLPMIFLACSSHSLTAVGCFSALFVGD